MNLNHHHIHSFSFAFWHEMERMKEENYHQVLSLGACFSVSSAFEERHLEYHQCYYINIASDWGTELVVDKPVGYRMQDIPL